ncbi:MAG: selenite/tellurite reduction operon b-type cytochrome iron-sulfur cluster-binding subunit ExtO [Syntrophales bacterium]
MRSTISFIAACCLALFANPAGAADTCTACHPVQPSGIHASLSCRSCHNDKANLIRDPAAAAHRNAGCTGCHRGYGALFDHAMSTRTREKRFFERTAAANDPAFFQKNCDSCHLQGCTDCHGGTGHRVAKATDRECLACHKGYFVGADYHGMAPRQDSLRYQRGHVAQGETYLKMLPDVHAEAGMACGACHSMKSMMAGRKSAKTCLDCHQPKQTVIEHRIGAHREKLECFACHSAWTPQEYGTFYLRFTDSPSQKSYRMKQNRGDYVKSAYLRTQDAPPLGTNSRGKVSPIRPEFILYFSDIRSDMAVGAENRLLAAEWKAFFPHTVRRGAVMCEGCHDTPRRFLLERPEDRIYQLQADGMTLGSFWDRAGQRVVNGGFLPESRYRRMTTKTQAYWKAYLAKWQHFLNRVAH